jgi:hypothetical protein
LIHAALLALVFAASVQAASLPGRVDPVIVGNWNCGNTRVAITNLGRIALTGETARSGRARASEGRMLIAWDLGGMSDWSYAAGDGALVIGTDRGANYACLFDR